MKQEKSKKKATKKRTATKAGTKKSVSANRRGETVRVNLVLPGELFSHLEKEAAKRDPRGLIGRYITRFLLDMKAKNLPLSPGFAGGTTAKKPLQTPLHGMKTAKFPKKALFPIQGKE